MSSRPPRALRSLRAPVRARVEPAYEAGPLAVRREDLVLDGAPTRARSVDASVGPRARGRGRLAIRDTDAGDADESKRISEPDSGSKSAGAAPGA